MQTFPGNCTRNQIEEFPRTRINISVWQYSPVRSLAACARATPKIHCPSTGVYRRSPQLTRIEISTFFLYTDYGRSLTRNAAPVQARSLHEEYRVQASRYKPRASPWDSKHRNGKRVYGICASPYVVGARTCTGYCRIRWIRFTVLVRRPSSCACNVCTPHRGQFLLHTDTTKETTFQLAETSSP